MSDYHDDRDVKGCLIVGLLLIAVWVAIASIVAAMIGPWLSSG